MHGWLRRGRRGVGVLVVVASLGITTQGTVTAAAAAPSGNGTFGTLTAVDCPTAQFCMATGEVSNVSGGSVLATTDGGRTWSLLAVPPGAGALHGVACPTKRRCEVVGAGNGDAGAVYGTRDGGRTWQVQPAVIGGGYFLGVACRTPMVCEATGAFGSIFGTVDGGTHWTQQPVPPATSLVQGVSCPTRTTCEAVGYGSGGMALRTVDAGATWERQTLPASAQFLNGVACPSMTDCVAVGIDFDGAGGRQVGVIVTTSNGGATWSRRAVPSGFVALSAVTCPTVDVCEAVGLGGSAILGTVDRGATWVAQTTSGAPYLLGVDCQGPRHCEAVGQDANSDVAAFGTVDGGQHWTRQSVST